jgi:alkanesulfonate monooxygenase SsuD/methylene tetrahydromethanopterin reductase-like flavin-dependent oxidoreductase (luciferase family)
MTNGQGPDLESLELWTSLTWLAGHTSRIEFGPMVSPVSFRHPVNTARMASAVDDLSGGRLRLGLGAGWQDREHDHFGFDLLPIPQRLARYREGVEVTVSLLRSDTPVTFEGDYYHLRDAILLPRPQRQGGPAIVIGGKRGVLALAAQYADEWNVPFVSAATFADLSRRLDQLLRERGRASDQVRRTLMTNVIFGHSRAELQAKLAARARSADDLHAAGILVGVGEEVREQLGALAAAGVQTVMLQWLDLDDLDGLARFARAVLP